MTAVGNRLNTDRCLHGRQSRQTSFAATIRHHLSHISFCAIAKDTSPAGPRRLSFTKVLFLPPSVETTVRNKNLLDQVTDGRAEVPPPSPGQADLSIE